MTCTGACICYTFINIYIYVLCTCITKDEARIKDDDQARKECEHLKVKCGRMTCTGACICYTFIYIYICMYYVHV